MYLCAHNSTFCVAPLSPLPLPLYLRIDAHGILSRIVLRCRWHTVATLLSPFISPPPLSLFWRRLPCCLVLACLAVSVEQSTSSRASKGLEQALSDLEEERRARQRVAEELSKLEDDAAALRSEEKRVKVRILNGARGGDGCWSDCSERSYTMCAFKPEQDKQHTRMLLTPPPTRGPPFFFFFIGHAACRLCV